LRRSPPTRGDADRMNKKAFVTGAGGCVGRRLLAELIDQGWEVTALLLPQEVDRFAFKDHERVHSVVGDINTCQAEVIPEGSAVFHLAAQVHSVPKTPEQRKKFFTVNLDGTEHMARLAAQRSASSFVFLSTIAVYGDKLDGTVCNEQTPPDPKTPYAQSKLQAEAKLTQILGPTVRHVILRPCVIYGPGDRGNFARLINSVLHGRFPVVKNGHARKNTLYVANLAKIMIALADRSDQLDENIFNVADPEPHSLRQIAELVAAVAGCEVNIRNLPYSLLRLAGWIGDAAGKLLGREMPLSSRKLRVLTTDSLIDTTRLYGVIDTEKLANFKEGLGDYLPSLRK
jgi:nucleoside-diphosphate-sugar epimerase